MQAQAIKKRRMGKEGDSSGLKRENLGVKIVAHIVMIVAALLAIFPFIMMISSSITSEEALARYNRQLGWGAYLRLGIGEEKSGGRERDSLLADMFDRFA